MTLERNKWWEHTLEPTKTIQDSQVTVLGKRKFWQIHLYKEPDIVHQDRRVPRSLLKNESGEKKKKEIQRRKIWSRCETCRWYQQLWDWLEGDHVACSKEASLVNISRQKWQNTFHQETVHISMNIRSNVALKTYFFMMPLWWASSTRFHSASQIGYPQIWEYNNNNNKSQKYSIHGQRKNHPSSDFAIFDTFGGAFFLFQIFCSAPLIHPYGPEHKGVTLPFHHSTLDGRLPGLAKRTRIKEEKSMKK